MELEKPSRTQKKKAAIAMQKTGEALVQLSDDQLKSIALPAELLDAVILARTMTSHGARRRQLQYIGSLMRNFDADQIEQRLTALTNQTAQDVRLFKQVEQWRDRIVSGEDQCIDQLLMQYPDMNREELVKLAAAATESQSESGKRKAGKALFRYLRRFVS